MIQRLESAGLGYHVMADETTEKLGKHQTELALYDFKLLVHGQSFCRIKWL